jgi:hypothetical protein
MTGVVMRIGVSDNENGFAIEFTRMNPSHQRVIAGYVRSQVE